MKAKQKKNIIHNYSGGFLCAVV